MNVVYCQFKLRLSYTYVHVPEDEPSLSLLGPVKLLGVPPLPLSQSKLSPLEGFLQVHQFVWKLQ